MCKWSTYNATQVIQLFRILDKYGDSGFKRRNLSDDHAVYSDVLITFQDIATVKKRCGSLGILIFQCISHSSASSSRSWCASATKPSWKTQPKTVNGLSVLAIHFARLRYGSSSFSSLRHGRGEQRQWVKKSTDRPVPLALRFYLCQGLGERSLPSRLEWHGPWEVCTRWDNLKGLRVRGVEKTWTRTQGPDKADIFGSEVPCCDSKWRMPVAAGSEVAAAVIMIIRVRHNR